MKWTVDAKRKEAMTDEGYLITWAENGMGTYFNGYAPVNETPHAPRTRKHIEASYDKEKVKAALEAHYAVRPAMKPEEAA
jgi:hypothetical protein